MSVGHQYAVLSMLSRFSLFLFSSTASCATLPVHRSSPALNALELKVQIPMLQSTVWYLMTPWAPDRGSHIATIPRETEREKMEDFEDSNTLPCRVRIVFNLF